MTAGLRLADRMTSEAAVARQELLAALNSTRYLELVQSLVAAAGAPPLGDGAVRPVAAVPP